MKIESRQNEKIKWLFKLKQKKFRDQSNTFIVFGDHAVNEAIKSGNVVEIYTTEENIKGTLISEKLMEELQEIKSPTNVLAIVNKPGIKYSYDKILMLDNIQDPRNLGSLIRSAAGFGFTTIIASNDTVDFYNETTVRTSQGNLFYVNLVKKDLKEEIQKLKNDGYEILLTDVDSGISPKEIPNNNKLCLVLGNEGSGVSKELLKEANILIKINTETVESLNVAIAGAIIMYEVKSING